MNPRAVLLVLALLLPGAAVAADAPGESVRLHAGDDPRWAAPEWDDHDWERTNTVPVRTGIHWLRFHLRPLDRYPQYRYLSDGPANPPTGLKPGNRIDGVFLAVPFSYEFYWDGRLIGRSGTVGATREAEQTGSLDHVFPIPPELLGPGEHLVAIRLSSFHFNFPATHIQVGFLLCNRDGHFAEELRHAAFPLMGAGGALLVALISALLYGLAGRWRPLLLCSLLSLALAAFYLLVAWRWLGNDPYEWLRPRLIAIAGVITFVAGIFPWLLLEQFAAPRRAWWFVALVPLLGAAWVSSPLYEVKALWLCRAMLGESLVIAGWAAWRRRPGAWPVVVGVLASLLLVRTDRRDFLDPSFFAGFSILVLYVFATLGLQLRRDRRRTKEALLTAARLELELLRKNLQPHFLLNTLLAISEVIERDPPGAVQFIDDLAAEFRALAAMSGERLVPLARELDLCRAHLKVISRRTGRTYDLQVEGGDETVLVPPAIFLTLIENGLIHQRAESAPVFRLTMSPVADGRRWVFLSPGRARPVERRADGGTGLRYVRARLEESFPGRWTLTHGPVAAGWETVIGWRADLPAGGGA